MKRVAFRLGKEGRDQDDLRKKLLEDFTAHNPLLAAFATLERKLLNRGRLIHSQTVEEAMDGKWRAYASSMVRCIVEHVLTANDWMPQQGIAPESADGELLLRMADEALLYLTKMRPSRERQGLDVTSVVRPFISDRFPLSRAYMQSRGL